MEFDWIVKQKFGKDLGEKILVLANEWRHPFDKCMCTLKDPYDYKYHVLDVYSQNQFIEIKEFVELQFEAEYETDEISKAAEIVRMPQYPMPIVWNRLRLTPKRGAELAIYSIWQDLNNYPKPPWKPKYDEVDLNEMMYDNLLVLKTWIHRMRVLEYTPDPRCCYIGYGNMDNAGYQALGVAMETRDLKDILINLFEIVGMTPGKTTTGLNIRKWYCSKN